MQVKQIDSYQFIVEDSTGLAIAEIKTDLTHQIREVFISTAKLEEQLKIEKLVLSHTKQYMVDRNIPTNFPLICTKALPTTKLDPEFSSKLMSFEMIPPQIEDMSVVEVSHKIDILSRNHFVRLEYFVR